MECKTQKFQVKSVIVLHIHYLGTNILISFSQDINSNLASLLFSPVMAR